MSFSLHIKTRIRYGVWLTILMLCTQVIAFAQLRADFNVNKPGGCSPLLVAFTNTTSGASSNATYHWDFGNGNQSAVQDPGAIYKDEKIYTVVLTVKDGAQTSIQSKQVTVYQPPVVDFTVSTNRECLPTPVTFTSNSNAGSGTIAGYYWDFGDGNTQQGTINQQNHSFIVEQKATVSLTVTNSYGCYSTLQKKDIIEILPRLTAGFTADKRILCRITDPVQFTNTSAGPGILSYLWDFGDGTTSTQKDPSHIFNQKGIYTISLKVQSTMGCSTVSTQTAFINVASFSTDFEVPALICLFNNVTFNGRSTPAPNTIAWEIDGVPAAWQYDQYLHHAFTAAGTHTVTLTNTFGTCTESVSKQISVKELPDLKGFIAAPAGFCGAPMAVAFKDTTPGAVKWNWNFDYYSGGGTASIQAPSFTYNSDGHHYVNLVVTNADGCTSTRLQAVPIPKPSVYINWLQSTSPRGLLSCGPVTIKFGVNTTEPITQYNWQFGDGGSSTDAQPGHAFVIPGNYQVRLNYTTQNGCTGTAYFNSVTVSKMPNLDFTASPTEVCGDRNVTFTILGSDPSLLRTGWDFGYGIAHYNLPSPVNYSYKVAGLYTIKLFLQNAACDTLIVKEKLIKVLPPQAIISSFQNTCDGTRGEILFKQESKEATTVTWDFGDGQTLTTPGNQPEVRHTYTRTGTYTVKLTATKDQCTVSVNTTVWVYLKQQPVLSTTKPEICIEDQLPYTISNLEANPHPYYSWREYFYFDKWQYGDGANFTGSSSHSYIDQNGLPFSGSLRFIDKEKDRLRVIIKAVNFGCPDTSNYITVKVKGPVAGFEVIKDNICFKDPVILKDTSKSYGSTIQSRIWNFGDGNTSNQAGTVTHTYDNPGYYYVSLHVTDASGCTASTASSSKTVTVNGPKAAFYPSGTNVHLNTTVYFYNNTNNYNSYTTIYQWDFGNGVTSTAYNPSYTYTTPGTYTVTMTATNTLTGCSSTATPVMITVRDFNSAFEVSTTSITGKSCPPVLARFVNTSSNYTRVTWDFGDGIKADNLNYPSHIYEKPGKYTVTLFVYGPNGLTGQYTEEIVVSQPEAIVTAIMPEGCIGHTPTLSAAGSNTKSYTWDLGDGSMLQTTDTFAKHTYTIPGIYTPVLLMNDGNGCTAAARSMDKIIIRPDPVIAVAPAQPVICLGASTPLQATGALHYTWTPATGLSAADTDAPIAYPTTSTTYTVKGADDLGCTGSHSVTVKVVQPVTLQLPPTASICAGNTLQLQASGAELYNWIFTTTGLSSTTIPDPVASPAATTVYTVRGSDSYHCFSDTAEINVTVHPLPAVNAGIDHEVLPGTPVQLSPVYSNDVIRWNWSPAQYLSCASCATPVSNPMAQTMYRLTVWNQHNCQATDSLLIKMICEESRVAIPNAFSPNNDGVNDLWTIKGISLVKHLLVFNRWGQKVFERSNFIASDRASCWDGTFKGYHAPPGTYVYFVEMECPTGGVFTRKGTVVLTR